MKPPIRQYKKKTKEIRRFRALLPKNPAREKGKDAGIKKTSTSWTGQRFGGEPAASPSPRIQLERMSSDGTVKTFSNCA